jgi:hypothetical protein
MLMTVIVGVVVPVIVVVSVPVGMKVWMWLWTRTAMVVPCMVALGHVIVVSHRYSQPCRE